MTGFASIDEAAPLLIELEQQNSAAREYFRRSRHADPS